MASKIASTRSLILRAPRQLAARHWVQPLFAVPRANEILVRMGTSEGVSRGFGPSRRGYTSLEPIVQAFPQRHCRADFHRHMEPSLRRQRCHEAVVCPDIAAVWPTRRAGAGGAHSVLLAARGYMLAGTSIGKTAGTAASSVLGGYRGRVVPCYVTCCLLPRGQRPRRNCAMKCRQLKGQRVTQASRSRCRWASAAPPAPKTMKRLEVIRESSVGTMI